MNDVSAALEAAGVYVRRVYPAALSVASFRHACHELRPHFVLSVNHAPPLALLCSLEAVPYVSWSIDPLPVSRQRVLPNTDVERCLCFVHRRGLITSLRTAGIGSVEYLPLAAATRRASAPEGEATVPDDVGPASFVGGSLASDDAELERYAERQAWDSTLLERVDAWLGELLVHAGADLAWSGIESSGDLPAWLAERLPAAERAHAIELLNGRLGYWHRRRVISALADQALAVYGDEGWAQIARDFRGLAQHGRELTRIYRTSLCNLDIPRLYQREIVTLRAMDVLGAGGVLLSEAGGDLAELVSGEAFLTYRDLTELRARLDEAAENPERMRELARHGQYEVLRAHRIEHRVQRILEACEERGWLDA